MTASARDLIYDWNTRKRRHSIAHGPIQLYDETLRDGLQGPSAVDPSIEQKIRILELADSLGIDCINIGLPGAGPRAVEHVTALAKHIAAEGLAIKPSCAARTHLDDVRPVVEISQAAGIEIEVMAFLGTSPIRQYVEEWDLDRLLDWSRTAIQFGVKEGLTVTFVTEDTIRSTPMVLDPLFRSAIDCGAHRLCLCDTVGHATPDGVHNLIDFTRTVIDAMGADVGIDWHGHNDRGLALTNTLRAIEYGADRVHGTALGLGERVGNTALDHVLVNLKLLGEIDNDLSSLSQWCEVVAEATGVSIAANYPVLGEDAFRTATGVHAAAVIKAEKKGEALADAVYSGVPAGLVGRHQSIEVGPMSGQSNVNYWLSKNGYDARDALSKSILGVAKQSDRVLDDTELHALAKKFQAAG